VTRDFKQILYLAVGWLSLALGMLGIFLPLLPTTPFVLLAAFCFSRSNERLHQWLLNHPRFGSFIKEWENHGIIPLKAKLLATSMMTLMMSYPVFYMPMPSIIRNCIIFIYLLVNFYIWTRPSQPWQSAANSKEKLAEYN